MPRAVPRAVRVLLTIAVLAPGPFARGQAVAPLSQGKPLPRNAVLAEEAMLSSPERLRLEEMKVELAFLADMDTFPYSLGASARGDHLEVFGFVPDDMLRQRAVDLARRHTTLNVSNAIGIRSDLSQPAPARPGYLLQQEAAELLRTKLREQAKQITVTARANGVVALTGRTSSLESKLQVSRLLHQLTGCTSIDNQLMVEPIERGGQRMVQITRDGALLLPASLLAEPGSSIAPAPAERVKLASYPETETAVPARGQQPSILPPPVPTNGLITAASEAPLPTVVAPKRPNDSSEILSGKSATVAPAKLPVKWGRPATTWETQTKQLEPAHERAAVRPPSTREERKTFPPNAMPPFTSIQTENKQRRANAHSQASFADARTTSTPDMNGKSVGGEEVSEKRSTGTTPTDTLANPLPDRAPVGPPLRSARHWPPAYVTGPKPGEGRPGVIVFDDDSPTATPAPISAATPRRIVPAELQRRVKSLCGRQASEVSASIQQDGSLLVKVKVPNRSIEDELSRKILALPDMSAPNVRLLMDVDR